MRTFALGLLTCLATAASLPAPAQERPEIFVQLGHVGYTSAAAFSSDGRVLVTGGTDDSVKLWDARSALEIVTFKGHAEDVSAVTVSADLRLVASGDAKGTLKLWEVATGRELRSFPGSGSEISRVAFSADGQVISALSMGKLTRWSVSGGPPVATLERIRGGLFVSPSCPFVVRPSEAPGDSSLVDLATGAEVKRFKDGGPFASSAGCSRAGERVLFLGSDYQAKRATCDLVETSTGAKVASWTTDENVWKVGLSPDGKLAFTAGPGGSSSGMRPLARSSGR